MQLGLSTVLGVFAPLLQQFILEGKAAEDSGHDIKQVCTSWLGLWWLLKDHLLCCEGYFHFTNKSRHKPTNINA